ncbi:MAG: thioredoxin family protein [Gammaproteobacteria bacterium]|jgi:thiol:disulfide interchange protein
MTRESIKTKRWPIVVLIISAALVLPGVLLSQLAVDVSLRQWHENAPGYQAALEEQARTGKPLALFFHTDWCASCKQLRKDVLASDRFNQFLPNVIPVKINPETSHLEKVIADRFGVIGYPTFLIVSSNPTRIVPIRRTSNVKPEAFVHACQKALHPGTTL